MNATVKVRLIMKFNLIFSLILSFVPRIFLEGKNLTLIKMNKL